MNEQTFVFENVEVRKTGRTATKPAIGPGKGNLVLVEVTPVSEFDGTWKRWVIPTSLFNIVDGS